jgi:hypothetical protein
VSPFAAGCALCGATLDPQRHTRSARSVTVPDLSGALGLTGQEVITLALMLLFTLFAPLIGLLICCWQAYVQDREGRALMRNAAIALGLVCLFFFAVPVAQLNLLARLGLP